ncbi:MAG: hypothetical protein KF852_17925 [Saprospiraceae bacterium]|nr:hypothetical protein [Saprospiraceae bacterium]
MKKHQTYTIPVEVFRGEIVQMWNQAPQPCRWELYGENNAQIAILHPDKAWQSRQFPASDNGTVHTLLDKWVADAPVHSVQKLVEAFGLESYNDTMLSEAGPGLKLRLQTLDALLSGKDVVVWSSLRGIESVAEFVTEIRNYAEDKEEWAGQIPAFVVLDSRDSVSATMVADRILEFQEGTTIQELYVDF